MAKKTAKAGRQRQWWVCAYGDVNEWIANLLNQDCADRIAEKVCLIEGVEVRKKLWISKLKVCAFFWPSSARNQLSKFFYRALIGAKPYLVKYKFAKSLASKIERAVVPARARSTKTAFSV